MIHGEKFTGTVVTIALMATLMWSSNILAETDEEEIIVGQKNKAFTVEELKIQKGEAVKFVNQDSFFHNVFSLSDAKLFDLGSFPQGEGRSVTFDEVGTVEVECAIHPDMHMVIQVVE